MILESIFDYRLNPSKIDKAKSKEFGQFFTSFEIAKYMSRMITVEAGLENEVRILDAGAGEGILGISAVLHCIELGYTKISLLLYEVDPELIEHISTKVAQLFELNICKTIDLQVEIKDEDFILSRPDQQENIPRFDVCIINPPYFKYNVKSSKYSKALSDLYKGDPNIYVSFMAVGLACLTEGGQLISITPRSFTNGLYFKGFRHYLFANASLEKIHIFKARDKVFKNSKVLQENIICRFTKSKEQKSIVIASSNSEEDINHENIKKYDHRLVINANSDYIILVPENDEEARILEIAQKLPQLFNETGYYISTGPVVEFRLREYVVDSNSSVDKTTLLRPYNIKLMLTTWSAENPKNVFFRVTDASKKFLLNNEIYVVLKRFSSKDEKKRLVSSVYQPINDSKYIGFGNKLNYMGLKDLKLDKKEAYGLSALMNSSFMDSYFRCISGSTQVNATDIRSMRFPNRKTICDIGTEILKIRITQETIDKIVMKNLFK